MEKSTKLYHRHLELGAMMIPFANWQMPLHYGSQIEEHHAVRDHVGIFDVSHMLAIDIQGKQAAEFLRNMLANDISKLHTQGKALYTCMLNEQAGIIDDLIVYRLGPNQYRCVVNAGTAEKDTVWLRQHAKAYELTLQPRHDLSLLAVQGPETFEMLALILPDSVITQLQTLPPFHVLTHQNWVIAKTGYTGELGVEIMLPHEDVISCWDKLVHNGVKPIGLGARDSLRLEAGLNLYGTDMDENVSPDESNLTWTVDLKDLNRDFIGKEALLQMRQQGLTHQLVGVVLLDKGVCRPQMAIYVKDRQQNWLQGNLTSGSFSPTLSCGIGLARIPVGDFTDAEVEIRGKRLPAKLVKLPFYHRTLSK